MEYGAAVTRGGGGVVRKSIRRAFHGFFIDLLEQNPIPAAGFVKHIYSLPKCTTLLQISYTRSNTLRARKVDDDVDLDALASLTEGYSGADVAIVCRDAAMMSVRRVMKGAMEKGLSGPEIQKHVMEMKEELAAAVTMEDFQTSLRKVIVMRRVERCLLPAVVTL